MISTAPPDSQWDWVAEQTRTYLASGGTKDGADEDPDWFKNLRTDPSVGVQVGTRRFTGRARVASPAEREALRNDAHHLWSPASPR